MPDDAPRLVTRRRSLMLLGSGAGGLFVAACGSSGGHTGATDSKGKLTGGHVAHTGNVFPTEAVNTAVYKLSPYKADTAAIVPQARDFVYSGQHGSTARMKVTKAGNQLTKGLVGRITVAVDPTASPAPTDIHS
jgi:hypothetical protein